MVHKNGVEKADRKAGAARRRNGAPSAQSGELAAAAVRHPVVKEVEASLQERCGLTIEDGSGPGQRIMVALSGGADSTALLLALTVLRDRPRRRAGLGGRVEVAAVHVHHHLRASAEDDASHCQRLCETLGVACHVEHVWPGKERGNVMERARSLRLGVLRAQAEQWGARAVVTGHHAQDQLETMIMMLCRGAGLDGLCGIPSRRSLGNGVWLMRPMLGVMKSQCMDLCWTAGVQWREDQSNANPDRARGALRASVIGALEELWPGAAVRAAASAEMLSEARELVEQAMERAFETREAGAWNRGALRTAGPLIVGAGLRREALQMSGGRGADRLSHRVVRATAEAVCDEQRSPRRFTWANGVRITVRSTTVHMERVPATSRGRRVVQGEPT